MIVTVFRSRLAVEAREEYSAVAKRMSELARTVPGYVSHKGFVAEDGERVTIVEFETEEGLQAWKVHPDHVEAKRLGFATFFGTFKVQICKVVRDRTWTRRDGQP
ncbi:antibiotic biosynthesis monooxygenase family protein [Phreatobacter sp. AB_2022a]|uniref:antibiotic biosynthesis monooxygenase family protein n=1 Tax=Phreatobacter sp. AB_2022a TaxID=3003134 RepID=UPI0022871185|nr:antibiotic biosynthesis monooxygenase [Phreatobacter sp. AB_2022a]MCZ0736457.1 antibiotic biosynthesis monooxygenase [Phreatobacter sp. AB_2022a]